MFGQLAGRSVFNTPTGYHPNSSQFRSTICKRRRHPGPLLPCTPLFFGEEAPCVGRTRFGNRARVVGLARSPTMQTPSPTTKLLASMLASEAAAERVFSAQPVVQEAEAAGKDLEDEAYGGLLLKATLSEEVNGLGATAAAARLSCSRAGRPKPRHAKDGASILVCLADELGREGHLSFISSSLKKKSSLREGGRYGHGQRSRAKVRPVAGKSPKKGGWPAI